MYTYKEVIDDKSVAGGRCYAAYSGDQFIRNFSSEKAAKSYCEEENKLDSDQVDDRESTINISADCNPQFNDEGMSPG